MLNRTGVADLVRYSDPGPHLHQHRSHVLAADAPVHARGLAVQTPRFAEKEAGHIQGMRPHADEDEAVEFAQKWLVVKHREAVGGGDASAMRRSQCRRAQRTSGLPDWTLPPQFPWTSRRTFAVRQTAAICCAVARSGARGFWQMTGSP